VKGHALTYIGSIPSIIYLKQGRLAIASCNDEKKIGYLRSTTYNTTYLIKDYDELTILILSFIYPTAPHMVLIECIIKLNSTYNNPI